MKTVLLYSGGLDSTIARRVLQPDMCVYFDLGGEYSEKEAKRLDDAVIYKAVLIPFAELGETRHIPFRNLSFAIMAYNIAVQEWPFEDMIRIAIIGVEGDDSEDKSEQAFQLMTVTLNAIKHKGTPAVQVFSPFWKKTKGELVKLLVYNEPDYISVLEGVVSCYSTGDYRCGACPACARFWVALESSGIDTTGWFKSDIRSYAKKYYKGKQYASATRNEEIKRAFQHSEELK